MSAPTTNTNCLAGLRCPKCGALEPFYIAASCWATMFDDGSDATEEIAWDDGSACRCISCRFAGTVAAFAVKAPANLNAAAPICDCALHALYVPQHLRKGRFEVTRPVFVTTEHRRYALTRGEAERLLAQLKKAVSTAKAREVQAAPY